MSDFLFSFGRKHSSKTVLGWLKGIYTDAHRPGQCLECSYGVGAVLEDHFAEGKNIVHVGRGILAWVGDMVTEMSEPYVRDLAARIREIYDGQGEPHKSLQSDDVFRRLNGAFALLLADNDCLSVVTDPVASVPVYVGLGQDGKPCSMGTHQDLVAALTGASRVFNLAAAAEFLALGGVCFPNTMYSNVRILDPGSVHRLRRYRNDAILDQPAVYWRPPPELRTAYDENALAEELRSALVSAVQRRCSAGKVGVSLSGGLDSRLIMAAVPNCVECIGLTFCDHINRETQVASRVASCYKRQWFPIFRPQEYVANILEPTVRFIGCEGFFAYAHALGLANQIAQYQVTSLLSGMNMDTFLKCYCARDMKRISRLGGLLPASYAKVELDVVRQWDQFWVLHLAKPALAEMTRQRQSFFDRYADSNRTSLVEWLRLHPVLYGFATWPSERRVLPIKHPILDRQLLEFAFKCPLHLKLGKAIFCSAARDIYGPGRFIGDASDGVMPASGHLWRLGQRAIRKLEDSAAGLMVRLGKAPRIEHSWYDYQGYWEGSKRLAELVEDYGSTLDQFDSVLFRDHGRKLLYRKDIDWHYGFRILQLAVWAWTADQLQNEIERTRSGCLAT